ncbi:TonB-dependent receptor [Rhizorhabdus dicambivorans]|nr:TonB-dependent receptor [Rhizorhabdus dicambivorans]
MRSYRSVAALAGMGALAWSLALPLAAAQAQETANPQEGSAGADRAVGLEEIVVTAQRRAGKLQDTPIAVTALTGATMERARVQNFGDLVTKIPGFSINSLSRSRTNPALRGGSSSLSAPGADNAVALFVDDIYYGSAGDFEVDLFDIERVEVLRGPQGTLFGRNSTGGSIAVVTRDPKAAPEGSVEVSAGNYDLIQARGFVTSALDDSEHWLGSLAFTGTNQAGTSFNRTVGRAVDTTNRMSLRGKIKWVGRDDLTVLISGDYSRKSETNEARDFLGAPPSAAGLRAVGYVPDRQRRLVDQFDNGSFDSTSWGGSVKVEAEVGAGTLSSISGYRRARINQTPTDLLGLPVLTVSVGEPRKLDQFTQELRWISPSGERLTYVGGLYFLYQKDRRDEQFRTRYDPTTFAGALQAATFCPLQGDELNFAVPGCVASRPDLFDPNSVNTFQSSKVYSYAAYLQGTYELIDTVRLTAGARVTRDRKTARGFTRGDLDFIFNPVAVPGGFEGTAGGYRVGRLSKSWTAFTPKITIDWKPREEWLVYATVSKGYRSGAFQLEADATTAAVPIEPEYVWNYEAGLKSRFLDNRAQLNLAFFQANYRNLQFSFTDGTTGDLVVSNAGKARVRGVEAEAVLIVADGLTLSANYSYQVGHVRGFPVQAEIPDGQAPGQTPRHSLNLSASYAHELPGGGELSLAGDFQYKSKYQLEINPDPAFTSRVKGLVNGSISYRTANEKWQFTIWGKNLTDENIVTYGQDFRFLAYSFDEAYNPDSPRYNVAAATANMPRYAPPRTYGATVRLNF